MTNIAKLSERKMSTLSFILLLFFMFVILPIFLTRIGVIRVSLAKKIIYGFVSVFIVLTVIISLMFYGEHKMIKAKELNEAGLIYARTGDYAKAIEKYKEAISYYPGYWEIYSNLSHAYSAIGMYGEALDMSLKAREITRKNLADIENRTKKEKRE